MIFHDLSIQELKNLTYFFWRNEEMFEVFNMGTGFCLIVEGAKEVDAIAEVCKTYNLSSQVIDSSFDGTDSQGIVNDSSPCLLKDLAVF